MKSRASEKFIRSQLETAGNEQMVVFTKDGRRIPCWIDSYNGGHKVVIIDGDGNSEQLDISDITNVHFSRDPRVYGYRPRP